MALYIPPVNFGIVEADIYRCGQPCALNLPFLERLHLKAIIDLEIVRPDRCMCVSHTLAPAHSLRLAWVRAAQRTPHALAYLYCAARHLYKSRA